MGTHKTINAQNLKWPGASKDQLDLMKKTYEKCHNKSSRSGSFVADIPSQNLETIEGRFKAKTSAARACKNMFRDARAAISSEKKNIKIGLTSAYRSASHQYRLWQKYFPDYYNRTAADRKKYQKRSGLVDMDKSAEFMCRYVRKRVATPGFSNHQNGLAVDLLNIENGITMKNSSAATSIKAWQQSWFWEWLSKNANSYGFYQNTNINEPWHWEYKETASPTPKSSSGMNSESRYA